MSTKTSTLRRWALVLALAPLALATVAAPARADDHRHWDHDDRREHHERGWERHDRDWHEHGYYVAPPPPVYYAPPRPSPGISLFFPIR